MWVDKGLGGPIGVQRKTVTDLLASEGDGRLQREMLQLQQLRMAWIVVEGRPTFTLEGYLNDANLSHWTRDGYRSLLRGIQSRGILVEHSDDMADTVALIESIAKWVAKGTHRSLDRRPKSSLDRWGQKSHRGTQSHILQSIDNIGPSQADAIIDAFGGVLPLAWTATEAQLKAVKGLGPKRVAAMTAAIALLPAAA